MTRGYSSNTRLEYAALNGPINLSDGHSRTQLNDELLSVLRVLPATFARVSKEPQYLTEDRLIQAFARLAGQRFPRRPLLSYSVSSLVTIIASHLRQQRLSVAMAEPSFDNIRDLLLTGGLDVYGFAEEALYNQLAMLRPGEPPHVLWLTSPANPSGHTLDKGAYQDIARVCAETGTILVVDHCFRFFASSMASFDQYAALESACGLQYFVLEDTGKTVPFLEMKVGMLVASDSLYERVRQLNEELILAVSPCVLQMLSEAMTSFADGALHHWLLPLIESNKGTIEEATAPFSRTLCLAPTSDQVPFLWYRTESPEGGEKLASLCANVGLHILPGTRFFMQRPSPGSRYVRVALARDAETIRQGASLLAHVLWHSQI